MSHSKLKFALSTSVLSAASLLASGALAPSDARARPAKGKPGVHSYHMAVHSRGRLGARVITISDDLRLHFGAPRDAGLLVDQVLPDTPAARAGLQSGDLIVSVEGQSVSESWDIFRALKSAKKGDRVKLAVVRNKKKRTLSATLDSEGGVGMHWGNMPKGQFDFDFDPGSFFRKGEGALGEGFPFELEHGPNFRLQEQIRRLEERLNKLEGKGESKSDEPGAGAKKWKTPKSRSRGKKS